MQTLDWSALGSWLSLASTLIVGVFVYGRLTEKVNGHDKRIEKLEDKVDAHGSRIAHLEGWEDRPGEGRALRER